VICSDRSPGWATTSTRSGRNHARRQRRLGSGARCRARRRPHRRRSEGRSAVRSAASEGSAGSPPARAAARLEGASARPDRKFGASSTCRCRTTAESVGSSDSRSLGRSRRRMVARRAAPRRVRCPICACGRAALVLFGAMAAPASGATQVVRWSPFVGDALRPGLVATRSAEIASPVPSPCTTRAGAPTATSFAIPASPTQRATTRSCASATPSPRGRAPPRQRQPGPLGQRALNPRLGRAPRERSAVHLLRGWSHRRRRRRPAARTTVARAARRPCEATRRSAAVGPGGSACRTPSRPGPERLAAIRTAYIGRG
jgi:hypothetical protein